jgi:hypothetical protein
MALKKNWNMDTMEFKNLIKALKKIALLLLAYLSFTACWKGAGKTLPESSSSELNLEEAFANPPDTARAWVYWVWVNGNISKEGITRDLEAMWGAGISGWLLFDVSGPWWAPAGDVKSGSAEWHECVQWAISESERLGMSVALAVDCGYGSGGPHITPDNSMQELVWSTTPVEGGREVELMLPHPEVDYTDKVKLTNVDQTKVSLHGAWLRPGEKLSDELIHGLEEVDSYRDVAVFAYRASNMEAAAISKLNHYDGRNYIRPRKPLRELVTEEAKPLIRGEVVDLTDRMSKNGMLEWNAPEGTWMVIRLGHASNFKLTRPEPAHLIGLEADRLDPRGIEAHFEHWLKPILEGAGDRAGSTLRYIHVDSWEALFQNWSGNFRKEFECRRGYAIDPWLPVLTGHIVESVEKTERFLWDMRLTVSETILDNYISRLRELIAPYEVGLSNQSYGRVCINNADWTGRCDLPVAEFWTERMPHPPYTAVKAPGPFPVEELYWQRSLKGLSSVANAYGKYVVAAEAFSGCRGWLDHPYTLKWLGDDAFSRGINKFWISYFTHQPYEHMKPGMTHRKWGQLMNRNQTWWSYVKPYFEYVARSQYLLQQGRKVADVACLFLEGAPLCFNFAVFDELFLPEGYDYDMVTTELLRQMAVEDGRLLLPSGMSYRYLVLPNDGMLTLETARKVEELIAAGGRVYPMSPIEGTPGLAGYPEANERVREMAQDWSQLPEGTRWEPLSKQMAADGLKPDFEGRDLNWIHRHTDSDDIYFVANPTLETIERTCTFRVAGKTAELWDPETGDIHGLPEAREIGGCTRIALEFGPARSWFVVFRDKPTPGRKQQPPFQVWQPAASIDGPWTLNFDPEWGTDESLTLTKLASWTEHTDSLVKYYSGTGTYATTFELDSADLPDRDQTVALDLGQVDVVARVKLNGRDCGITWKPPYRIDITDALQPGRNELQVKVANTWVNRMIGDQQLPEDSEWRDWETLIEWPDWIKEGKRSPTGRYTFCSVRHYAKDAELQSSGLLGPVRVLTGE